MLVSTSFVFGLFQFYFITSFLVALLSSIFLTLISTSENGLIKPDPVQHGKEESKVVIACFINRLPNLFWKNIGIILLILLFV